MHGGSALKCWWRRRNTMLHNLLRPKWPSRPERVPPRAPPRRNRAMKNTPRSLVCPHDDCPSHERGARPHVIRHSTYKTRRGPRRRLLCKVCRRTFVATRGTVYYRLRSSRQAFDRVMSLLVEGNAPTSVARALHMCASTVSR
jgi:transposase-like protein